MSTQFESTALNAALEEKAPELQPPVGVITHLQRGIVNGATGEWETEVEVKEMTGADEEYLASIENKDGVTYTEYMAAMLKRAVVRIGNIDVEANPVVIDSLSIGDRDITFLAIIKATYGETRTFVTRCPHCTLSNDITIDLNDDFPLTPPSIDLRSPLVVTLRNGESLKLRVPNSGDNSYVSKKATSVAAQNTLMISRCVVWDEGKKPQDTESWAKSLGISDRSTIVTALLSVEAGPKLEGVNIQCAHCGEQVSVVIDWISLLLS